MAASFLKNIKFENFEISSENGTAKYAIDGDIKGILSFDYEESIFSPTFIVSAKFIAVEGVLSDLKLHGTETANITIKHDSGDDMVFEDLIVTNMIQDDTTSNGSIFSVVLRSQDVIMNESERLSQRYDPKTNASTHVDTILGTNLKTSYENDIEDTANNDGFYGNYWTPYRAIYWLARRAVSKSMSGDGSGTNRVGFLFWQTRNGYRFKSVDTIMADGNTKDLVFSQHEVIAPDEYDENHVIFNPTFELPTDIVDQMRLSRFGEERRYVNLHSLYVTKKEDGVLSEQDVSGSQDSLGEDDDLSLQVGSLDIRNKPSRPTVSVLVDGTMRQDGTISISGEGEFHPHKVVSQSRMRYQSLLSNSLKITVPMNLNVESGDVIVANILKSKEGDDEYFSGEYIVKDLRHSYSVLDNDGVECLTIMRLVRDWHGKKSEADGSMSSINPEVGRDTLTGSYVA